MSISKSIQIENRFVGDGYPAFIVAEAGVNHNGNIKQAEELIRIAKNSGADAVKFQMFKTENLILKNVGKAAYQKKTTGLVESQFDMLKKLEITINQAMMLKKYCEKNNIIFLITPFDEWSLEKLDELRLPAYKVASTDLTNLPFIKKIAKKGKPVILSTGMSYLSEIELALNEIKNINNDIILLQCSANYPLRDEEANLRVLDTYKKRFDVLVGFSDHTIGIGAAPYAVAMGANLIEKHFTIDKNMNGPDHKASLNPNELKVLIKEIRKVEKYLGSDIKNPTFSESNTRRSLQKCLVAAKNIKINELFTENNIVAKRTGGRGFSPVYYRSFIGKLSKKNYQKDEIILDYE